MDIILDLKTADGKYNFTDGVGQISSELNRLVSEMSFNFSYDSDFICQYDHSLIQIHAAIGVNVDDGDYISSVLQIRYGGCKGTVAVNPLLDGQEKQLIFRESMNKFISEHEMLELCKRSLKRKLKFVSELVMKIKDFVLFRPTVS